MEYAVDGCNYGEVDLSEKTLSFSSQAKKRVFDLDLSHISQCVVPSNNYHDLELQFGDVDKREKKEDCLVSIVFHFPSKSSPNENEEEEENEEEDESQALALQQKILDSGVMQSATGEVVIEFSRDQATFAFPRGKFGLQFTRTHMIMQGNQYSFRIPFTNIEMVYMLTRAETGRFAFVIQLANHIRQGNQKYRYLVLETHDLEESLTFNLSQEVLMDEFGVKDGPTLTKPMSSIFGVVFKSIAKTKVLSPKYESATKTSCIRCSIKTNDGYLFPAAKCFIFINKPTLIIYFEDIECVEFLRFDNTKNAATRNFDLQITMKSSSLRGDNEKEKEKEYTFVGIYRSEFNNLKEFIESKEIRIENLPTESNDLLALAADDDEDDDEDYSASEHSDDSDDDNNEENSDSDDDDEVDEEEDNRKSSKKQQKSAPVKKETKTVSKKRAPAESSSNNKKSKRQKKDKNAPKRATTAFMAYSNAIRSTVQKEHPGLKITEVSTEIGKRWKSLTDAEKEPYNELAKDDKVRYEDAMKEYKRQKAASGRDDDADEESDNDQDE